MLRHRFESREQADIGSTEGFSNVAENIFVSCKKSAAM